MIPIPDRLTLKFLIRIGAALLLALLAHDRNHWKSKTAQYAELLASERAANAATVANYRAAADRARRADAANAERVRAERSDINERTKDEFENRIAAARAAVVRLRTDPGAKAHSGGGRITPVPELSAPAKGLAQAPVQDRLPQTDRLTATEQAIQLDELIKWVKAQAQVDPSKD
jgi:hypothetical protein